MKLKTILCTVSSIFILHSAFGQGALTPPGAPAATMKTLAQIEPRTPISSLPFTISSPGSYYVTTNLTVSSGASGITIFSGNVTLDLGGFTLQGVPGSGNGIVFASTYNNVVVRNGILTGWGAAGVNSYSSGYSRNVVFEHLTVSANNGPGISSEADCVIHDCSSYGNTNDGINIVGGLVTDCISRNNGGYGFSGGVIEAGSGCTFRNCLAEDNVGGGFTLTGSEALDCDSQFNGGAGFNLSASTAVNCNSRYNTNSGVVCAGTLDEVRNCRIYSNQGNGIFTTNAGGAHIVGNTISQNGQNGIYINSSQNYVENNEVQSVSSYAAILIQIGTYGAVYSNNVVVKNLAFDGGNGSGGYIDNGHTTDFGPVGTAASATNPWANIFH